MASSLLRDEGIKMKKKAKRRKMCMVHFGDDDIVIDGFRLNPVHLIDEPPHRPEAEYDFYLDTGDDCYLLRLRNSPHNRIVLCKHDPIYYDFIYIVVEKPLLSGMYEELKFIVDKLKNIEIPTRIYTEIEYDLGT